MGFLDFLKGKPKAPSLPAIAVNYHRANIELVMTAKDQANIAPVIHSMVPDFRTYKALDLVLELRAAPNGTVHAYSGNKHVGELPPYWYDGGRILMARVNELDRSSVMVLAGAEWERKAGPFVLTVGLGHSAQAANLPLVLYSDTNWS